MGSEGDDLLRFLVDVGVDEAASVAGREPAEEEVRSDWEDEEREVWTASLTAADGTMI
jgi:hypothetical protein